MAIGILSGQRGPDGFYDPNRDMYYRNEAEYRHAQEVQRYEYERMLRGQQSLTGNPYNNAFGLANASANATPAPQPVKPAPTGPAEPNPLAFMNNVNNKLLLTGELK